MPADRRQFRQPRLLRRADARADDGAQQPDRFVLGQRVEGQGVRVVEAAQPPAARDQHQAAEAAGQQRADLGRGGRVVEHDQESAAGDRGAVERRAFVHVDRNPLRGQAERAQQPGQRCSGGQRRQAGGVAAQVHEQLPVREAVGHPVRHVHDQGAFADPAHAVDCRDDHGPGRSGQRGIGPFDQGIDLSGAAGEHAGVGGQLVRRRIGRKQRPPVVPRLGRFAQPGGGGRRPGAVRRRCGRGSRFGAILADGAGQGVRAPSIRYALCDAGTAAEDHQRGIGAEDLLVQPTQRGRRIRAEFVGDGGAQPGIGVQRLGRPPGPVQREHQPAVEALPQRVIGDQGEQFADQLARPAELQHRVDASLHGGQPRLFQAADGGMAGQHGHVGERPSPPQRERGRIGLRRLGPPAVAGGPAGVRAAVLEDLPVQVGGPDPQQVPGRPGLDAVPVRAEAAAQPGDLVVERGVRRGGLVRPHMVSASPSIETTWSGASSRAASSVRRTVPRTAAAGPPSCTCTGPSTPKSTVLPPFGSCGSPLAAARQALTLTSCGDNDRRGGGPDQAAASRGDLWRRADQYSVSGRPGPAADPP